MKTLKKIIRALGALVLGGISVPAGAQAVGSNGVVVGPVAAGTASTAPPVQVSGKDAGGVVRALKTDTSGQLYLANPSSPASSVAISNQAVTHYLAIDASGLIGLNNYPSTYPVTGTFWPYTLGQGLMSASVPVAIASNQSAIQVSGTFWQSVQPVSGTFWQATQPVSAVSLPLPSGAATAANQVSVQGTAGSPASTVVSIQGVSGGTAVPISGSITATNASVSTTGTSVPGSATMVGGSDGTNLRAISTDSSGRPNVNINGTVTTTGSGNFTVVQPTGTNLHAVIDSGSTTAVTGNVTAVQATGSNLHVQVDSAPTTTVTGTVTANAGTGTFAVSASSLPLPSGAAADATLTNGTQKTQIVSGANIAGVDAAGNVSVKGTNVSFTGTSSGNNTDLIASQAADSYRGWSFQSTAISGTATVTFQASEDGTTWSTLAGFQTAGAGGATSQVAASGVGVYGPLQAGFIRVHQTAGTGNITGILRLYTTSAFGTAYQQTVNAVQSGTWTVQQGSTPSTTPWAINPVAAATGGYSFSNLSANATTTIKSGSGFLHTVTINTVGGSSNTVTLYDNTAGSGTTIATIDTTTGSRTYVFDLQFSTGLTAVIGTGTACNLTCTWK